MKTIILALALIGGSAVLTSCCGTGCGTTYTDCCGSSGYGNWY